MWRCIGTSYARLRAITRHHSRQSCVLPGTRKAAAVTEKPTMIQSVQRALRLLEAVGEDERPVSAKMLARRTGIALPTAYHLLRTLVHEGYLRRTSSGYVLGEQVGTLQSSRGNRSVLNRARPALKSLRDEVGGAVYLALYQDGEIVLADIADSPSTHQVDLWVGVQEFGHATAFGKCVLASLDALSREDYLARHQLVDLTPYTLTDRRALTLGLAAQPRYLTDREEFRIGTACIAVPIQTPHFVGALAMSERARRYDGMLTRVDRLHRVAAEIGRLVAATY
ncbi:transcriptional regulator (plasmid) [Rhodococcus opacus]|uniref:Glycerol operon regulatory protein n=1 Tax=Rhodococcus opacus TaxID=37919 RepID=A0A1B1KH60_RHOOP|nr:transcriptional regulator [Rhodococcus opacus]